MTDGPLSHAAVFDPRRPALRTRLHHADEAGERLVAESPESQKQNHWQHEREDRGEHRYGDLRQAAGSASLVSLKRVVLWSMRTATGLDSFVFFLEVSPATMRFPFRFGFGPRGLMIR